MEFRSGQHPDARGEAFNECFLLFRVGVVVGFGFGGHAEIVQIVPNGLNDSTDVWLCPQSMPWTTHCSGTREGLVSDCAIVCVVPSVSSSCSYNVFS